MRVLLLLAMVQSLTFHTVRSSFPRVIYKLVSLFTFNYSLLRVGQKSYLVNHSIVIQAISVISMFHLIATASPLKGSFRYRLLSHSNSNKFNTPMPRQYYSSLLRSSTASMIHSCRNICYRHETRQQICTYIDPSFYKHRRKASALPAANANAEETLIKLFDNTNAAQLSSITNYDMNSHSTANNCNSHSYQDHNYGSNQKINHQQLDYFLDELANLNGGKPVNPRSHQQVSNLLYGCNYHSQHNINHVSNKLTSNLLSSPALSSLKYNGRNVHDSNLSTTAGPTDKTTLLKLIQDWRSRSNDHVNDTILSCDTPIHERETIIKDPHVSTSFPPYSMEPMEKQAKVAELVLQCRDLMRLSSSTNKQTRIDHDRVSRRERMTKECEISNTISSSSSSSSQLRSKISQSLFHKQERWALQKTQSATFSNMTSELVDSTVRHTHLFYDKMEDNRNRSSTNKNYATVPSCDRVLMSHKDVNSDTFSSLTDNVPSSTSASNPIVSSYEHMVKSLFSAPLLASEESEDAKKQINEKSSLDAYWMEPLLSLTKSSSRSLVKQLQSKSCPMGFDPMASPFSAQFLNVTSINKSAPSQSKKESLLSFVRAQKSSFFSDCILLIRVGDFYESYGIDAILLVEHAGLNLMAGKARAGCPWRNVQATLDSLTNAGFRVAVYEEWNGEESESFRVENTETNDNDDASGNAFSGKGSRLKRRYLAQVVSSANPTYMYGLVLNDNDGVVDQSALVSVGCDRFESSSSAPGKSYVGVIETHAGYTLVEISVEERTAVVSERLTAEAVSCRLVAYPPADPLFYVPPFADNVSGMKRQRLERLPFLPSRYQQHHQQTSPLTPLRFRVKTLPPSLVVSPAAGLTEVERAKQTIVSAFLRLEDDAIMNGVTVDDVNGSFPQKRLLRRRVSNEDFIIVSPSTKCDDKSASYGHSALFETVVEESSPKITSPLHLETATQLGLMDDPSIPPLISSLLPDSAPASCRRYLRRWLLVPPPPDITDAMSQLVRVLKEENQQALPNLSAPALTGKVTSMILAGQASATVYRNILSALHASVQLLESYGRNEDDRNRGIINPLMKILSHDTGVKVTDSTALKSQLLQAIRVIENVVSTDNLEHYIDTNNPEEVSYFGDVVPHSFFERNEVIWRGRVKLDALDHAHSVPLFAKKLAVAISSDFWGVDSVNFNNLGGIDLSNAKELKNPVVQDIFNNILAIRTIPVWKAESENDKINTKYYHPRDRNGKILRNRYTTRQVEDAVSDYVDACDNARREVVTVLTQLSDKLIDDNHLPAILQASHLNLIVSTAAHHAANANVRGWNTATIQKAIDDDSAGIFRGLWPYWMDKTSSILNTIDLNGVFLLTAPNMSGKSTVMRSTAAAALLISCGLCAPVNKQSSLKRFDSLFVRGASADIPTENKSAFGAEMGDVAALLRTCGSHSLVFVDEIGRGTSPRDGTSLAGAVLERMAEQGMSGMFATHLHGILNFPYSDKAKKRMKKKCMATKVEEDGELKWTYTLEDGVCTNSLAFFTAAKFGVDESVLRRAEELSAHWDNGNHQLEPYNYSMNSIAAPKYEIKKILEDAAGNGSSIFIPPKFMSPPSFEGSSCVYIVQLEYNNSRPRYYVGETDSLSQRLSQHRSRGKEWSSSSTIAIPVEGGKSSARSVESVVIQRMAQFGFELVSVSDGKSLRTRYHS